MKRKSWRDVYLVHPVADVFPQMSDDELADLGRDIKKNALQNRVLLWEQLTPDGPVTYVLDGRNRLDAMEKARFPIWDGDRLSSTVADELSSFSTVTAGGLAVSLNINRRHLTPSQRAKFAARAVQVDREFLKKPTANGQVSPAGKGLPGGRDQRGRKVTGSEPENKSDVARVAELAGVSRPTARKAVAEVQGAGGAVTATKPKPKPAPKAKVVDEHALRGEVSALLKRLKTVNEPLSESTLKALDKLQEAIADVYDLRVLEAKVDDLTADDRPPDEGEVDGLSSQSSTRSRAHEGRRLTMTTKIVRCSRCNRRMRSDTGWNVVAHKGRVVEHLCPDCQTPEENAEAVINEATLDYEGGGVDDEGRSWARLKGATDDG